jgi:hypothetical protein
MYSKRQMKIEEQILKIKTELQTIGKMRPGSLTKQYKEPKNKKGPYCQLSYTRGMKSKTVYIRTTDFGRVKQQVATYKRFRKLVEKWIDLAIEESQLELAENSSK